MAVEKIQWLNPAFNPPRSELSLSSSWKCKPGPGWGKQDSKEAKFVFDQSPTRAEAKLNITYSIPSGAKVSKAQLWATYGSAYTGFSVLTVNGNRFNYTSGAERGTDIILNGNSGTVTAVINFKANGNLIDSKTHISTVSFSNIYIRIEHDGVEGEAPATPQSEAYTSSPPPTDVCIYDQETGSLYTFDGVIKMQHQLSMTIEETPSKNKEKYVNNAKNEPDKLTLDVVMSDVYTGTFETPMEMEANQYTAYNAAKGTVEMEGETRSSNAYATLKALKESRKKLSVVTPQFVYVDMLISSIICNRDESNPYGWQGQIVLQKAYEVKKQKANATNGGDSADQKKEETFLSDVSNTLNDNKNSTGGDGLSVQKETLNDTNIRKGTLQQLRADRL